jgi:hypothetical protein
LKVTLLAFVKVAPEKFVPVKVTTVPTGPATGVKPVKVGGGMTVKCVALVAVPPGVLTTIGPVVAPAGTVAVASVSLTTVAVATTPLKLTTVPVAVKLLPVKVTTVPTGPEVGVKPVSVGVAVEESTAARPAAYVANPHPGASFGKTTVPELEKPVAVAKPRCGTLWPAKLEAKAPAGSARTRPTRTTAKASSLELPLPLVAWSRRVTVCRMEDPPDEGASFISKQHTQSRQRLTRAQSCSPTPDVIYGTATARAG